MTTFPDDAHVLSITSREGFGGIHFYGQVRLWDSTGLGDDIGQTRTISVEVLNTMPEDERRTYRLRRDTVGFDSKADVIAAAKVWMVNNAPGSILYLRHDWIRVAPEPIWDGRRGTELPTQPGVQLEVELDAPTLAGDRP